MGDVQRSLAFRRARFLTSRSHCPLWLEEGFRTLHDVQSFRGVRNPARSQNARFSLAHRLVATFSEAGNASRKPETTVTEATTAGRGDNCGVVHNGRGTCRSPGTK